MKKKFLKINNMKRFCKWLDESNPHNVLVRQYFESEWSFTRNLKKGLEKRMNQTELRDKFCFNRARIRPSWIPTFSRFGQYQMAKKLLTYVRSRYVRERAKKVKDMRRLQRERVSETSV
jgi:hypothetical protein